MTETNNPPKILEMSMCVPPRRLTGDAELLATFGVLMWPMRIDGLQLVRNKGELRLWSPTKEFRFLSDAKALVIEAAMNAVRDGLDDMEELAGSAR
ncbi:hypothetical protein [Palleronia sp. LCG004]|uniref:hypothetical protein n=1 Tax=Palleronia sp. LCG004 TaxID=3079304 RepID=UPI0029431277|nr:hypothetical protein [Palleronia sp. LCG004]WOI55138.1 hypothetical protein RVY76_08695 [Palleronia sp. LCG004]